MISGKTGVRPEKKYTIRAPTGAMKDMTLEQVMRQIPDLYEGDLSALKRMAVGKTVILDARLSIERTA